MTRTFVAGRNTLIARALIDLLSKDGAELVGVEDEPRLTDADMTTAFFADTRPEIVFLCAGLSGGIGLNRAKPVGSVKEKSRSQALLAEVPVKLSTYRRVVCETIS